MGAIKVDEIDFSKTLLGADPIGPLAKLLWECQELHRAKGLDLLVRMYMSLNAASTSWHLTEWVWLLCPVGKKGVLTQAVGARSERWDDFASAVRDVNSDIAICRQLATAGKHVAVSRGEMKNLSVETEPDAENGTHRVWICVDDARMADCDVYARALRWWIDLYIHIGFPEAQRLAEALQPAAES